MRQGISLDANEHPWIRLCDFAACSPDFDVCYRFNRAQAVAWLAARLRRYGHDVAMAQVEAAYDAWSATVALR